MTSKKLLTILATFTLFISLGFAQSGELDDEDFELEVSETELEVGEILEAEIDMSEQAEESDLEYRFEYYEQEAYEQPIFEQRVEEDEDRRLQVSVEDSDGESLYADSELISVEDTREEGDDEDDEVSTHPVEHDFELETGDEETLVIDNREHTFNLRHVGEERGATLRIDGENRALEEGESVTLEDSRVRLEEIERASDEGEGIAAFRSSAEIRDPREPVDEPDPQPEPEPEPSPEVEMELDETVEPGETFEAQVTAEGLDEEELDYRWRVRNGIADEEDDVRGVNQPEISFETRPRVTVDNPEIHVRVRSSDGFATDLRETFEWELPDFETEGLEVEYDTSSITASISEEEFRERPEIRTGTALDGWNEISVRGRGSGGAQLEFEQLDNSDFEDDNDLIPYSVVEISGDNIQGLQLYPESDVSEQWLYDEGLLISTWDSDISYYEVSNGDWERLPTMPSRSNLDDHIEVAPGRDRDPYELDGDTIIALAGDPDGIETETGVLTPQGECEQFDEDEPVPPGYEELDVHCGTFDEVDRVEDRFERLTSSPHQVDEGEFGSEIDSIENHLENNRPGPAQIELDQLRMQRDINSLEDEVESFEERLDTFESESGRSADEEREQLERIKSDVEAGFNSREEVDEVEDDLNNLQRGFGQRSVEAQEDIRAEREAAREAGEEVLTPSNLNREAEQIENLPERTINQLPEELEDLEDLYDEPEDLEDRFDQVDQMIEDDELEEAQDELEQIEEDMNEAGLEEIQEATSTYNTIERLRDHEEVEEEHLEDLDRAEELLVEEHNIEEASELVEDVEMSVEVQQVREVVMEALQNEEVRELIRDVISEVVPGL